MLGAGRGGRGLRVRDHDQDHATAPARRRGALPRARRPPRYDHPAAPSAGQPRRVGELRGRPDALVGGRAVAGVHRSAPPRARPTHRGHPPGAAAPGRRVGPGPGLRPHGRGAAAPGGAQAQAPGGRGGRGDGSAPDDRSGPAVPPGRARPARGAGGPRSAPGVLVPLRRARREPDRHAAGPALAPVVGGRRGDGAAARAGARGLRGLRARAVRAAPRAGGHVPVRRAAAR